MCVKIIKAMFETMTNEPKSEAVKPAADANPTTAFKKYCEERPDALECRIYED